MTLKFVNHVGQPVSIERLAAAAPRKQSAPAPLKRVTDPEKASQHLGWEIVGVRKSAMATARADHELRQRGKPENKRTAFDGEGWLRKQKDKRVVSRVFQVESAARLAAELVGRDGSFLRLHVQPILKG